MMWETYPSQNSSGGILCLWNKEAFFLNNSFRGSDFLGLEGVLVEGGNQVTLVNVHSPCDLEGKQRLWSELKTYKASSTCFRWCMLGDFNSV